MIRTLPWQQRNPLLLPLQAQPAELFQLPAEVAEFTRVALHGRLDTERSVYVGPRPRSVMGTAKPG